MVVNMHPQPVGFASDLVDAALHAALAVPARVPVFALSGLQGTGKSTLAAQMADRAQAHGKRAVVLSLDDLYLPHADRQQLARTVHPLLATRGPPGTHDVALGCALLDALRTGEPVTLPRFDKLADDRLPMTQADGIDAAADLIIVEGWCLGAPAEDDGALEAPLNALERQEDPQAIWRRYCNVALARDYPALWQRFDCLWFLQPPGFEVVVDWRWQQEQALAQAQGREALMDRDGVARFVQHFERVSRQALRELPGIADQVIALDAQRRPRC